MSLDGLEGTYLLSHVGDFILDQGFDLLHLVYEVGITGGQRAEHFTSAISKAVYNLVELSLRSVDRESIPLVSEYFIYELPGFDNLRYQTCELLEGMDLTLSVLTDIHPRKHS